MNSLIESLAYYSVRTFGFFVRLMPITLAFFLGRVMGHCAYMIDIKHRRVAYSNIKIAFAASKSPREIKNITRQLFINFGLNLIELFRMPLLSQQKYEKLVKIEGSENIDASLEKKKGCILLAMHFGSWEMASLSCAFLDHPYKIFVKDQKKFSKLHELLNLYRACGGSVVLSRGIGTRDFIKSLKNNEIIGMVADQGGRDGVLVPFFNRMASMSVGALRMGLKYDVPICFSVIIRQPGGQTHKVIIDKELKLEKTGNMDVDIRTNLKNIAARMEHYIRKYPSEYMWYYKIWKYSDEAHVTILSDGKVGHLRQSQGVSRMVKKAYEQRKLKVKIHTVKVTFKSKWHSRLFSITNFLLNPFLNQGSIGLLKHFLDTESYHQVIKQNSAIIISCGSSVAAVNNILAKECRAKSIAVLKPGILSFNVFDMVILPQHDIAAASTLKYKNVVVTKGALNIIDQKYLQSQTEGLLNRYSHLKTKVKLKIGVFIGGNSKSIYLNETSIKILLRQLREVCGSLNAELLVTTSRRTPAHIEHLLHRSLKKESYCQLLILANQENVDEAVGGILGLSDIVLVSGDSISMVSEAASSSKQTIVFMPQRKEFAMNSTLKHFKFIDCLNEKGYIFSSNIKNIGQSIYDIAKGKIQTRPLDDNDSVYKAVRKII